MNNNKKLSIFSLILFSILFLSSFTSAWDSSLSNGLISYYNFNGTQGNIPDVVEGKYNVTNTSQFSWDYVEGIVGQGGVGTLNLSDIFAQGYYNDVANMSFDGASFNNPFVEATTEISLNFWVNDTYPSYRPSAYIGSFSEDFQVRNIDGSQTGEAFENAINSAYQYAYYNISNKGWTMLTITAKEDGDWNLYVNGVLMSNLGLASSSLTSVKALTNLYLGSYGIGQGCDVPEECADFWDSYIALDEMGLWNRELNQTDIDLLYQGGLANSYSFIPVEPSPSPQSDTPITNLLSDVGSGFNLFIFNLALPITIFLIAMSSIILVGLILLKLSFILFRKFD